MVAMVTDAVKSVNLDFDARVPIPFSVFPSSYRSDAVSETTQTRVEGEVNLEATSRVEREDTRGSSAQLPNPRFYGKEEVDLRVQQDDRRSPRNYSAEVDLTPVHHPLRGPPPVYDQTVETQLDLTERDYRRRTSPTYDLDVSYDRRYQPVESYGNQQQQSVDVSYDRTYGQQQPVSTDIRVSETTRDSAAPASNKMGYYDDEGHYHSFRRGVERAADRIMHPFHHHDREEVVVNEQAGPARFSESIREDVRIVEPRNRGSIGETVPIPCHFIRIGDILILQGRPCQVIRISVSPQTGQHRYLGVDLFTRQLQEESSFVSNPSPSVVVQTMLGPVYKTYRILDLREDGRLVAMTETGDVKQGLPVIPQGSLFKRIRDAFADGRGSVRALVINDGGRELVVDFKVIHGSRL
ncbi:hypothetical protein N7474_001703 [Penicillium riverlandense]|uniref:uncharacterized protein n=1 Tax=Penicillium riverlandense TaxID=1903569 RepID=UPI0025492E77|nr:uncharacterized protein N7474_001703 [Penicillium riverlandense]KAJ5833392.1 hypothetical protein N7474_001703 [Penicillium riverlandense]